MPASNVAAEKRSQPKILVETAGLSEEEWLAYRRKGIGGSDVAALLGISPWRTARDLYFDKLNIVAVEDILACRIDRAKELLADREKKISEIAALVGYERQSSFSAAFHQKTGITPNEFRRQFWSQ